MNPARFPRRHALALAEADIEIPIVDSLHALARRTLALATAQMVAT